MENFCPSFVEPKVSFTLETDSLHFKPYTHSWVKIEKETFTTEIEQDQITKESSSSHTSLRLTKSMVKKNGLFIDFFDIS
jgi:hypothetical protein